MCVPQLFLADIWLEIIEKFILGQRSIMGVLEEAPGV